MSYLNRSNAAYDFSNFAPVPEPDDQKTKKDQKQPLQKKHRAKKNAVKPGTVVKWAFISFFVMMSVGSIMVGNIKITQLNDQVANAQKALDTAKSNEVSLNAKLEARMSMTKVEDYATNKLGLVKVQSYQIQYVHLTDKDKVVVSADDPGVTGFFKKVFNSVLEYFE
jgi:hypothetical protein